jgi:hypothetical protein
MLYCARIDSHWRPIWRLGGWERTTPSSSSSSSSSLLVLGEMVGGVSGEGGRYSRGWRRRSEKLSWAQGAEAKARAQQASKQAAAAARGGLRPQFTSLNRLSPRPSAAASCCLLHKQQQQPIIITVPFEKKKKCACGFICLFTSDYKSSTPFEYFPSRFFVFTNTKRIWVCQSKSHRHSE